MDVYAGVKLEEKEYFSFSKIAAEFTEVLDRVLQRLPLDEKKQFKTTRISQDEANKMIHITSFDEDRLNIKLRIYFEEMKPYKISLQ